ncbi:lipocalin family protein [Pedobacter terrae]|uniref:lipocalin family protein n=1 Tax=Pedobacter terrae TaxID=405671 RepID=UPI002FFA8C82
MRDILMLLAILSLFACKNKDENKKDFVLDVQGTWQLVSATTLENGTSQTTDYSGKLKMIKLFNHTHFAFLKHSHDPKDSSSFDAGGGTFSLNGNDYIETLEYYKDKDWEGKTFKFKLAIQNDTLVQKGIEKVEKAGVDRVIIEKYIKIQK